MRSESRGSVRIFYPRYRREEVIRLLRERLARLAEVLPLRRAVLFGSYARGDYTVASDVDLLLVYRGPARPDAYALAWKTLDLPRLELHLYTEEEYERLRPTLERMTREGVPLYPAGEEGG